MRRLWEVLLVLLGVALAFYISESIPRATIQRDAGAAVVGLVVCVVLVVLWEKNGLALRSPIIRREAPVAKYYSPSPERIDSVMRPALTAFQAKADRAYSDATPADLFARGNTPNLTDAERARLLAPHIGRWLRIEGVVDNVLAGPGFFLVVLDAAGVTDPVTPRTFATFQSDVDRVAALPKGARIRVTGRFSGLSAMNAGLTLTDCELLN